jgi:hypothetical protein
MNRPTTLLLAATLACASSASGEEAVPAKEKSEEELAKEAQNPVADLYSFPFQENIGLAYGPNKAVQNILNFEPVIPIHAGPVNIITRTIVPLITQPNAVPGEEGATTGLGNINLSAFVSPAKPGALIWGIGPSFNFPTATSPQLGSQSTWGLGPAVVLLTMPGPWVIGVVANNIWRIAGAHANALSLQYFINYNFGGGWCATSQPGHHLRLDPAEWQSMDCAVRRRIRKTPKIWQNTTQLPSGSVLDRVSPRHVALCSLGYPPPSHANPLKDIGWSYASACRSSLRDKTGRQSVLGVRIASVNGSHSRGDSGDDASFLSIARACQHL